MTLKQIILGRLLALKVKLKNLSKEGLNVRLLLEVGVLIKSKKIYLKIMSHYI